MFAKQGTGMGEAFGTDVAQRPEETKCAGVKRKPAGKACLAGGTARIEALRKEQTEH